MALCHVKSSRHKAFLECQPECQVALLAFRNGPKLEDRGTTVHQVFGTKNGKDKGLFRVMRV